MILRDPCLPPGWYPREKAKIEEFLAPFAGSAMANRGLAAIAPHAGWYYSSIPAALAVSSLIKEAETVVVIGGHLPQGMPILYAREEGVRTPSGVITMDRDLREEFKRQVPGLKTDQYEDNTVEVLLPMVHYFFPTAQLLWLRFPAELSSFEAGKLLAQSARNIGRRITVLGSTDLTHYGANYGFCPQGKGKAALEWVKTVNDAAFIDAVLEEEPGQVLRRGEEDSSACSVGAVLGVLGFAATQGMLWGRLLDYRTSADVKQPIGDEEETPDSFVGYAAISFSPA